MNRLIFVQPLEGAAAGLSSTPSSRHCSQTPSPRVEGRVFVSGLRTSFQMSHCPRLDSRGGWKVPMPFTAAGIPSSSNCIPGRLYPDRTACSLSPWHCLTAQHKLLRCWAWKGGRPEGTQRCWRSQGAPRVYSLFD